MHKQLLASQKLGPPLRRMANFWGWDIANLSIGEGGGGGVFVVIYDYISLRIMMDTYIFFQILKNCNKNAIFAMCCCEASDRFKVSISLSNAGEQF